MVSGKQEVDEKVISAIERVGYAFRVLQWDASKRARITPLQLQLLDRLVRLPEERCTVSQLAADLALTKATVSDAVRALAGKGLVIKRRSARDGRIAALALTDSGQERAAELSGWKEVVREQLASFADDTKEEVFVFLAQFIAGLRGEGVISSSRMCLTCSHYRSDGGVDCASGFCSLAEKAVDGKDIQVDCNTHVPRADVPSAAV